MATTVYSRYVETEARKLLANRHQWHSARNKETGVSFIAVPSGERVYHVHPRGKGCDCDATQVWHVAMCKHRLAVQFANEEDAAFDAEIARVLGSAPKPKLRYEDIFKCCRDCGDLADGLDGRCSKCASDAEWAARRGAR